MLVSHHRQFSPPLMFPIAPAGECEEGSWEPVFCYGQCDKQLCERSNRITRRGEGLEEGSLGTPRFGIVLCSPGGRACIGVCVCVWCVCVCVFLVCVCVCACVWCVCVRRCVHARYFPFRLNVCLSLYVFVFFVCPSVCALFYCPKHSSGASLCFLARGTVSVVRVLTAGAQRERTKDMPTANSTVGVTRDEGVKE